jgi:hypothetical protein
MGEAIRRILGVWRRRAGVLLFDSMRYARVFSTGAWTEHCNRNQVLRRADDGPGCHVDEPWSSDMAACHVFPSWGALVMRQALRQWPFRFRFDARCGNGIPDVSFIIPHRGRSRLPLLRLTIASILGQEEARVECIVVEQSPRSEIGAGDLPPGTRHLHLPHPSDPEGWHFAWAFNEGARVARADRLIFHDGDIPAPCHYAREAARILDDGWSAAYLQRFLFCLDEEGSATVMGSRSVPPGLVPGRVRQNWKGGTRAVRRSEFFDIGGFDEAFVGWGGEDVEFFDRLLSRRLWRFGYLPFLHLWHPPQAAKINGGRERNLDHMERLLGMPREQRVTEARRIMADKGQVRLQPPENVTA